jgi:hypothetical protein
VAERACRRPPPQQSTRSTLAPSSPTARSAHVFTRYCFALIAVQPLQTASCSGRSLLFLSPPGNHCAVHPPPRLGSIHLHSTVRSDLHRVRLNTSEPHSPLGISTTSRLIACHSHSFIHALLLCMPTSCSSLAFTVRDLTAKTPGTTRVANQAPRRPRRQPPTQCALATRAMSTSTTRAMRRERARRGIGAL